MTNQNTSNDTKMNLTIKTIVDKFDQLDAISKSEVIDQLDEDIQSIHDELLEKYQPIRDQIVKLYRSNGSTSAEIYSNMIELLDLLRNKYNDSTLPRRTEIESYKESINKAIECSVRRFLKDQYSRDSEFIDAKEILTGD